MSRLEPGVVVWITGLAGAGKTTLARAVADGLRARGEAAVVLDGDELREALRNVGYTRDDRMRAAYTYGRLAQLVSRSGPHAVCATVSMFEAVRARNRAEIARYLEVFLKAPLPILAARHPRQIYDDKNVVGVDIDAEEPAHPDLILDASGAVPIDELARQVLSHALLVPRGTV